MPFLNVPLVGWFCIAVAAVGILAVFRHWKAYLAEQYENEGKIAALGGHANSIPHWLPFGLDLIFMDVRGAITHTQLQIWQKCLRYGKGSHTVEVTVLNQRIVFTDDPANIRAVLANQFQDYGKGGPFHKDWYDFLGNSVFTVDGQQWQDARRQLRPQFFKTRLSDPIMFERHVQKVIDLIPTDGDTVDLASIFMRYTMDVATDLLLGKSTNSLENPDSVFIQAFAHIQKMQNILVRAGPANGIIPRSSFKRSIGILDAFIEPYINDALLLSAHRADDDLDSRTSSLFLYDLATSTRDRKVLRDQFAAMLLAGRDTTASALNWLFYELSQNSQVVSKLRKEIIDRVGPYKVPIADDLKCMKYLKHVVSETLRLYPPVPFNVRLALNDTTLPTGGGPSCEESVGILKDTAIAYSVLTLQRRPDLWPLEGPSLDVFCPERWENFQPQPWRYLPFNGGPRHCMGEDFALMEIKYTMVRILQRYKRIEARLRPQDQFMKTEIVSQPGAGVPVGLFSVEYGAGVA